MTIRTIVLLVAFAALSFGSLEAAAQCVTGVDTGGGGCVPPDAAGMPGYKPTDAPPPPPPPVWADSWGAVVFDRKAAGKGLATDQPSKADAVRVAMGECRSGGFKNCELITTYYNQCVAVAWGGDKFGVATNAAVEGADDAAMRQCAIEG